MNSTTLKIAAGVGLAVVALVLLRFKPWEGGAKKSNRPTLTVGFLPVT